MCVDVDVDVDALIFVSMYTYSSYCQLFPSIQSLFHFLVILLKCETIFPTYLF